MFVYCHLKQWFLWNQGQISKLFTCLAPRMCLVHSRCFINLKNNKQKIKKNREKNLAALLSDVVPTRQMFILVKLKILISGGSSHISQTWWLQVPSDDYKATHGAVLSLPKFYWAVLIWRLKLNHLMAFIINWKETSIENVYSSRLWARLWYYKHTGYQNSCLTEQPNRQHMHYMNCYFIHLVGFTENKNHKHQEFYKKTGYS